MAFGNANTKQIVSKASATLTGYETQSIAADHRDMCKVASKDDPGYQRISRVLKRWAAMLQSPRATEQRPVSVLAVKFWLMRLYLAVSVDDGADTLHLRAISSR